LEEAERLIRDYNEDNKLNPHIRFEAKEIGAEHAKYISFVDLLKRIKKRVYCNDIGCGK
jgi:hypothetical protein